MRLLVHWKSAEEQTTLAVQVLAIGRVADPYTAAAAPERRPLAKPIFAALVTALLLVFASLLHLALQLEQAQELAPV